MRPLTPIPLGPRTAWWSDAIGRGLVLPHDTSADPRALARTRLQLDAPLEGWVVQRSRHTLTLEEALWVPCPAAITAGGVPYRELRLTPREWAIWRVVNDARSVRRIAEQAGCETHEVLTLCARLGRFESQAVQLWPRPVRPHRLRHLVTPPRPANTRDADATDAQGRTTLAGYHDRIRGAQRQFDDVETTVAHALAPPHPGLRGVPYGAALREVLRRRGFDVDRVVEVGCGTGEMARDWGPTTSYLRIDRSPGLLADQASTAPDTRGLEGDALALPLASASIPTLISNEVLADLPSTPTPTGWDNDGSRAFVDEIARVLAPGGHAFLSEFGVLEGPAEEAVQLDHPEVSIRFDRLAEHARSAGLQAELVRLDALLEVDLAAEQLSRHSWMALRALAHARGVHLEARAWTRDSLGLPWAVEGLDFQTLADEGPGPLITRFWALLLARPAR